jgi:hypothetical protein
MQHATRIAQTFYYTVRHSIKIPLKEYLKSTFLVTLFFSCVANLWTRVLWYTIRDHSLKLVLGKSLPFYFERHAIYIYIYLFIYLFKCKLGAYNSLWKYIFNTFLSLHKIYIGVTSPGNWLIALNYNIHPLPWGSKHFNRDQGSHK